MPSAQVLLEETISICKEIADGLGAQEQASQAWEDSVTEVAMKLDELSVSFFFKTMPGIPVTRACHREAAALLELRRKGDWTGFAPALEQFLKAARTLIEKAGMKGTTLT